MKEFSFCTEVWIDDLSGNRWSFCMPKKPDIFDRVKEITQCKNYSNQRGIKRWWSVRKCEPCSC
jgi:hypothetical protein